MRVGITYNIRPKAEGLRLKKDKGTGNPSALALPPDFFAEWDDDDTIKAVHAILAKRHDVVLIEADKDAYMKLKTEKPDIVFNIAEGLWGDSRESQIPAILDMLRISYTGSSKGIRNNSIVSDKAELKERVEWIIREYRQPALAEEFLDGREFTVAMVGNGSDLRVLPIVEINYSSLPAGVNPIYSYEAKWIWDTPANPLEIL